MARTDSRSHIGRPAINTVRPVPGLPDFQVGRLPQDPWGAAVPKLMPRPRQHIASAAGFCALATFVLCVAPPPVCGAEATWPGVEEPPAWAYPVNPPDFKPAVDDGSLRHVPGSSQAYTLTQLRDFFMAPDWHPGDHPVMPEVVARGRKPDVLACGFCHRADGPGGPENANLAGLPAAYIVKQMADFKSGARKSSVPSRLPSTFMTSLAVAASATEIAAAAGYFSGLKPRANVSVVETTWVPQTYVAGWHLAALPGGGREPIDRRIIEVPETLEHFVSRLRPDRQHRGRPCAGGRRRRGQDGALRGLSWSGLAGVGGHSATGRPVAHVPRPPALRFQAWRPGRQRQRPDATDGGTTHDRRHDRDRGVRCFPAALICQVVSLPRRARA
jgi:cytochrome c553